MTLKSSPTTPSNLGSKFSLTLCLKVLINDQYFIQNGQIEDYKKEKALARVIFITQFYCAKRMTLYDVEKSVCSIYLFIKYCKTPVSAENMY